MNINQKARSVVDSCETPQQAVVAFRYISLAYDQSLIGTCDFYDLRKSLWRFPVKWRTIEFPKNIRTCVVVAALYEFKFIPMIPVDIK